MDQEKKNMVILGLGFMALFATFNTLENLVKPIFKSYQNEDSSFHVDGFVSLSLLYLTFAICLWFVPSVISILGPRYTIIISSLGYSVYAASFFFANVWVVYGAAVVNGISAALLWTGEGNYIISNSTSTSVSRNTSIFWVFYKCSLLFGNIFAFFALNGKSHIDSSTRSVIIIVLLVFSVIGNILLLLLKKPVHADSRKNDCTVSVIEAFRKAIKIAITPNMLLLSVMFCFVGFQVAVHSGIYSGAVGFSHQLGYDSKKLIPLVGICIGLGEVLVSGIISLCGTKISKRRYGKIYVVFMGVTVECLAFALIILNIPDEATFGDTDKKSYIDSSLPLSLLSGGMIGFGDGCYTSQIFSLLEIMYPKDSPQTVALFNCIYGIGTAVFFYLSTCIGLHTQMVLMIIFGMLGVSSFAIVTFKVQDHQ